MGSPVDPLFITFLDSLSGPLSICIHPRTYLRTREDFFTRQIAKVPAQLPQCIHNGTIQVLYGDGSRVVASSVYTPDVRPRCTRNARSYKQETFQKNANLLLFTKLASHHANHRSSH